MQTIESPNYLQFIKLFSFRFSGTLKSTQSDNYIIADTAYLYMLAEIAVFLLSLLVFVFKPDGSIRQHRHVVTVSGII